MSSNGQPTVFVMEANAKATLPVIESLARGGLRVVVGSDKRFNGGFYSRYSRQRCVYPSARLRTADFQQWLLTYLRHHDIDMLFPVGNYGTMAVSEIQDQVRRYTRLLLPNHAVFLAGYAKISTMRVAVRGATS